MAKQSYSKPSRPSQPKAAGKVYKNEASETYQDRNLAGMSPDAAQNAFQPTDAEPIPLHKKMAGC